MKQISKETFSTWLDQYAQASADNDPQASANLFLHDAKYYETPFSEPMVGKEAIYEYWKKGAQKLKDKKSTFEILAVTENLGIALWKGEFIVIETGAKVELDGVFLVEFGDDEKCSVFREWWHRKVTEPGKQTAMESY